MCSRFDWAVSIWAVYPKAVTVSLHNALVSAKRAGLQFDFVHVISFPPGLPRACVIPTVIPPRDFPPPGRGAIPLH